MARSNRQMKRRASDRWLKVTLILALLLLLGGATSLWALPRAVDALPGRYRQYIPDELLALVTTPLPTALPAPAVSGQTRITIAALAPPTATPTPTAVPPLATPTLATAVEPSPTPTETPLPTETPTATPYPLPPSARIDGMRVVGQRFNNCGPATLSINLNFYGHNVNQLEVAAVVRPEYEDRNVTPWELRDYVLAHTPLRATVHSGGDLDLLKRFVAAGLPVVIEKGYEPSESLGWMGHYVTIFGYDEVQRLFYTMDTYLGPWDSSGRPVAYDTIAHYWQHFNYVFYLVYRPEQEALVQELLGPDMVDPVTMWRNAGIRAQAETTETPNNAFAWFNLGTNFTQLGELTGEDFYYENAAAAYDQARTIGLPPRMLWYQFDPYVAYLAVGRYDDVLALAQATFLSQGGRTVEETYLYQGHALKALGDPAGATAAYRRALQMNPNFAAAHQALSAVE